MLNKYTVKYIRTFEIMIVSITIASFSYFLADVYEVFYPNEYNRISDFLMLIIYIVMYIFTEIYQIKNKKIVRYFYELLVFQISGLILIMINNNNYRSFVFYKEVLIGFIVLFMITELRFKLGYNFFKNISYKDNIFYLIYYLFLIFFIRTIIFMIIWIIIYFQQLNIIEIFIEK